MDRNRLLISSVAPDAGECARRHGLGIEIAEYCTAWNMDEKFAQTDAAVREHTEGVTVRTLHAPFNELFPCAIDPLARKLAAQRYRQAIELARRYDAHRVVIHGGYYSQMYYPVWYTAQSIEFWNDFIKDVPEDMILCLENVFEPEPGIIADIIKGVNDLRLRLCLDIGHANAYSHIPVMKWLEECAGLIAHFHIHNNMGDTDSHNDIDDGTIPMKDFLCAADALCGNATLAMEVLNAKRSVKWLEENGFI